MNRRIILYLFNLCMVSVIPAFGADEAPYSKSLSLTLAYSPAKNGSFVVILKNTSKRELDLMLNTREVEGEFNVFEGKEKVPSFFDKDYLRKCLTSMWFSGVSKLKPDAEIKWTVPLDELVYFGAGDKPVTRGSLSGKSISLNLDKLGVFPASGKSIIHVKARSAILSRFRRSSLP